MVLIINNSKIRARAASDIFYYMGVLSYAVTPNEALAEISPLYRSVVIMDPELLTDAKSYVDQLHQYNSAVPVFAITDSRDPAFKDIFCGVYPNDVYSSDLIIDIAKYQREHGLKQSSYYRLAGIEASCNLRHVSHFDKNIRFTKTETMILRYLIASYPTPQGAKSILKYAFKPLRTPDETSIRTHVSSMNRKFRKIKDVNLITAITGSGYVIETPEIQRAIREKELVRE